MRYFVLILTLAISLSGCDLFGPDTRPEPDCNLVKTKVNGEWKALGSCPEEQ